jgi:hypothetical protein
MEASIYLEAALARKKIAAARLNTTKKAHTTRPE